MSYHYSATPHFRELFDCPSYCCLVTVDYQYVFGIESVKHNFVYSLIVVKLATCFDPAGSSSGLHYEPINARKLRTFLGFQQCLQKININIKGLCPLTHKNHVTHVIQICTYRTVNNRSFHYKEQSVNAVWDNNGHLF